MTAESVEYSKYRKFRVSAVTWALRVLVTKKKNVCMYASLSAVSGTVQEAKKKLHIDSDC